MIKRQRLSFSAVSVDNKKIPARNTTHQNAGGLTHSHGSLGASKEHKTSDRKRPMKSSTYQYSKKRFGRGGRSPSYSGKIQSNGNVKIPPPEAGIIRIIPLGGVEEIGKNMTAIEIGEDIIVIDAGMHFSNEATPGVDYVIPNTTYLEERKSKIKALIITHGHLDHIGGVPLVLSRIGNPPVYSRNLSILMMKKRQAEFPH